jgi:translation initiation factor IF-2
MTNTDTQIKRSPVVAIMGHVDHGKSTLLDYIRKTNIVDSEAGGITQHLSAYEVHHKDDDGTDRTITFLDTPGHEAFTAMRVRGAKVADIAILIVSAEDGVKKQTQEAYQTIVDAKIPYIVAINKIDKPGANVEQTKANLAENEIYLEGFGGDVSFVEISAKQGTNVDELLSTILLQADLEEYMGDPSAPATGVVIESHTDPKKGITATLVIKNGKVSRGQFVVAGDSMVATRMLQDFHGKDVQEAHFSSPIILTGWVSTPVVGSEFSTFLKKKDAEKALESASQDSCDLIKSLDGLVTFETKIIPIVIKTDVAGTFEAVEKEICKLQKPEVAYKLIHKGVGNVSEKDINFAQADSEVIIAGFNVITDKSAVDLNEQVGATIKTFDIIYELTQWLEEEMERRRPRKMIAEVQGELEVLAMFSRTKDKQVIGGELISGEISLDDEVELVRRDTDLDKGKITNLQQNKMQAKIVKEGQCGLEVEIKTDIAVGDIIRAFKMIER